MTFLPVKITGIYCSLHEMSNIKKCPILRKTDEQLERETGKQIDARSPLDFKLISETL